MRTKAQSETLRLLDALSAILGERQRDRLIGEDFDGLKEAIERADTHCARTMRDDDHATVVSHWLFSFSPRMVRTGLLGFATLAEAKARSQAALP